MKNNAFEKLDLNLLRVFDVLYRTRKTSETAKRLTMSQPGISHALNRLREQLADPLFIRVGNKMEPTNRAIALAQGLPELLQQIENHCFPAQMFVANLFDEEIKIGLSSVLIKVIGVPLSHKLRQHLPKSKLRIMNWSPDTLAMMETGEVDLGINHYPLPITKGIKQLPIVEDPPALIMREGHPLLAQDALTIDDLVNSELAGFIIPELTEYLAIIEDLLQHKKFNFVLKSECLSILFDNLKTSDLILLSTVFPTLDCPKGIVSYGIGNFSGIAQPNLSIAIYHHQRYSHNPKYQLLTQCISDVLTEQMALAKQQLKYAVTK